MHHSDSGATVDFHRDFGALNPATNTSAFGPSMASLPRMVIRGNTTPGWRISHNHICATGPVCV